MRSLSIGRTILVVVVMFLVGAAVLLWHLNRLSRTLARVSALQGTSLQSALIGEFRTIYTSEVVERVRHAGIEVTHDYAGRRGAIPLPATLTIELGKRIDAKGGGMKVRLYSDYPFPWRKEGGGPQDSFERAALDFLIRHPDQAFSRFENYRDRPSLRYATADRMQASCIDCHNSHPDSPKRDWKVGDVRGVLEIIRPLDKVETQLRAGLRETFALLVALTVAALIGLALVVGRMRRSSAEIEQRAIELEGEVADRRRAEAALGTTTAELRKTLETIRGATSRLSSATTEILASTSQQAAGAQEQAAAVSQTITTVDEVTRTSADAAERTRGVGDAVQQTLEIGRAGRQAVEESIAAMNRLKEQAESTAEDILTLAEQAHAIGEIIASVDDIAEQTNMLALNAAIEAAQPGEHGKGFAVVASEVKALADQSKNATIQVRRILGEIQRATHTAVLSTEEVTKGVAAAIQVGDQTGRTIHSLAETLDQAAQASAQIVASAGQQATGMKQISQAMKNLDQIVGENLVATRQVEQAARDLDALGNQLAKLSAD